MPGILSVILWEFILPPGRSGSYAVRAKEGQRCDAPVSPGVSSRRAHEQPGRGGPPGLLPGLYLIQLSYKMNTSST